MMDTMPSPDSSTDYANPATAGLDRRGNAGVSDNGKPLQVKKISKVGHKFGKMDNEGFPATNCISQECDGFLGMVKAMAIGTEKSSRTDDGSATFNVASDQDPIDETVEWLSCFVMTGE
ncbi:hypothetical protein SAY86_007931 [Trapa natans]|uniref:Uncharacterized protein n=1 Tax=Trapa natans TaxID=22666 RepID=A0AAN7QYB9_TRANT|nr:hypothetical protein SAY86_007931 [Trapa natans]